MMISAGKNIHSASDSLVKITIDYLYHSIINPKQEIESKIRQLRGVRELDYKQYNRIKSFLPYIVCGIFSPSYRKKENFAYTEYFLLDIDNVSKEEGNNVNLLKSRIATDSRVLMSFVSPGEDGLKILFKLKTRCYDASLYSIFYKEFVRLFSFQYNLYSSIDTKTSDVSRACFISVDKNAYYNKDAETIDWESIIHSEDISYILMLQKKQEKELKESTPLEIGESRLVDPDSEQMKRIKEVLFKKKQTLQNSQEVFVPEEIDSVLDYITKEIENQGIELYQIIPIQYGKKLLFRLNQKKAEINLFYGKRGFTSVKTPKRGTNKEFSDICKELMDITLKSL